MSLYVVRDIDTDRCPEPAEFTDRILSEETAHRTEASIGELINSPEYTIPAQECLLGVSKSQREFGAAFVVDHPEQKGEHGIIVSPHFPKFLASLPEFDVQERAMDAAAVFVRALSTIVAAHKSQQRMSQAVRHRFESTLAEQYWKPEIRGSLETVWYRAAGLIASHAVGIAPVTSLEERVYPPHVAGIINPIPELRRFSTMLLKHASNSNPHIG